ncbi:DUF6297 family protein [Nocardioides iriomotensis]|uniref:Uncharacterized protein n=1 Tax=Nocardioides iriomotensis TaxID=715784 RepID=A0A4Q5J1G4_9ACTN|nr:DUF6297 family protein [Nocardioides iriomotensis]RYU11165.1 hypothetical protein ETU37_14090 [Nocardioides iriomotensis]
MTAVPDLVGPVAGDPAGARELRADIRHWRRGRVSTSWLEAAQDAYVAVFATLMIGAMAGNVVLHLRRMAVDECVAAACRTGRATAPWLAVPVVLALVVAAARLVGPVSVTPAVASWVLPAPTDRAAVLRPRLVTAVAAATVSAALVSGLAAAVAGVPVAVTASLAVGTAALAGGAVGFCAWAQARHEGVSRAAGGSLAGLAWLVLVFLAVGRVPPPPSPSTGVWTAALVAVTAASILALVGGWRALAVVPGRSVATAGALAPSLSGALAAMDLALIWDVLHARRWRSRGWVRPLRGRWRGPLALAERDLARLRRKPSLLVTPAAALVVPYVGATLGGQRVVVFLAAMTGFVACLGLFSGIRVLRRTSILERCLPLQPAEAGLAAIAVPMLVVLAWGLAVAPALHGVPSGLAGLVAGLAATTACVRWMVARPPDYRMPLVSSPGGAIPPALIGALFRGLDVILLTTGPLLLVPTENGALVSLLVGGLTLSVLLSRRP